MTNPQFKFRAKRIDNGEMVEGGYEKVEGCEYIREVFTECVDVETNTWQSHTIPVQVDPSTVELIGNPLQEEVDELKRVNQSAADHMAILVGRIKAKDAQIKKLREGLKGLCETVKAYGSSGDEFNSCMQRASELLKEGD